MANIDIRVLPKDLTAAYILSFIVHHDWDDIAPILTKEDKKALAPDQQGTIDLTASTKSFTISLPDRKNKSTWNYERPGSKYPKIYATNFSWLI